MLQEVVSPRSRSIEVAAVGNSVMTKLNVLSYWQLPIPRDWEGLPTLICRVGVSVMVAFKHLRRTSDLKYE